MLLIILRDWGSMRSHKYALLSSLLLLPLCSAQFGPQTQAPKGPWSDTTLSPDQRADLVIQAMTLDEKIQLVHGAGMLGFGPTLPSIVRSNGGGGFVPGIPRLGIPDLNMDDSSVGAGGGSRRGRYSTALPSSLALASSWNTRLAREYGTLIGKELGDQGFNMSLGGGVDITREARNGRNFEYMGEDPILAGNIVAQWIQGVQSQGIIGDIKHYAVNDQETGRYFMNAVIDKRAMRETDLLAFEIGVKQGKPDMVMCSYNLINGIYACENDYTLNQVLKKEWGFQGWVISDWFGTHSTTKAALAGLDMEQPDGRYFSSTLKAAVEKHEVPEARLNDMVHRILRSLFARGVIDHPRHTQPPDVVAGFEFAQSAAEETMVLLKNTDRLLPLNAASLKSIAVIGGHADAGVLSGAGSAQVDAAGGNAVPSKNDPNDILTLLTTQVYHRSPPLAAIREAAPNSTVTFNDGLNAAAAAAAAKSADVAIVVALQHTHEGGDLESLRLPDGQEELIAKVAAANPRTIVVVESGGPVVMPWANQVGAILEAWYPGIRGGQAIASVLFGKTNPSGKLAVTFPASDTDLPHAVFAPSGKKPGPLDGVFDPPAPFDAKYDEGLKVGYKWFDAEKKTPAYPFGFGLSYTTFAYSKLEAKGGASAGQGLEVRFTVQNTGNRAGKETAQVYVALPSSAGEPPKRLIGWEKLDLKPGESKTVSLRIDSLYVSVFNATKDTWEIVPGEYKVMAGPSSASLPLSASVRLTP
jgi:beta-glucosidase